MDEMSKELERLERQLQEEVYEEDILDDELLQILAEEESPAFDDPDVIFEPVQPKVHCNYSNDYGKALQDFAENGGENKMAKKKKNDKTLIGLMITASVLCLGILGILIYWMEAVLI